MESFLCARKCVGRWKMKTETPVVSASKVAYVRERQAG